MKRKQNIIIGLVAAAITFGSLYAFAGDKYFSRHRFEKRNCHWRNADHNDWFKDGERPSLNRDSIPIH